MRLAPSEFIQARSPSADVWRGAPPAAPGVIQRYGGLIARLGILVDGAIIFAALFQVAAQDASHERRLIAGLVAIYAFSLAASSVTLYRSWRLVRLRHELIRIAAAWSLAFCATWLLSQAAVWLYGAGATGRIAWGQWYAAALAGLLASRVAIRFALRYFRAFGHDQRRVAFIGDTDVRRRLWRLFRTHPWMGMEIVGLYDDGPQRVTIDGEAVGPIEDLVRRARHGDLAAVYICLPMAEEARIKQVVDLLSDTTVAVYYSPSLAELKPLNASWGDVNGDPVISLVESPFSSMDQRGLKRLEDLVLASLLIVLTSPILLIAALAVRLTSPGPALFRQTRYGLDGREFTILKFRSMWRAPATAEFAQAVRNDPRVTPVGALLRRTSIDELPQLFNVLMGDMSLVGPRPHPVKLNEDHRKLIPRYMTRHIVKPGITGWAQVNGLRGETEEIELMRQRVAYDLDYIDNWSIGLDLKILFRTVFVLSGARAY